MYPTAAGDMVSKLIQLQCKTDRGQGAKPGALRDNLQPPNCAAAALFFFSAGDVFK